MRKSVTVFVALGVAFAASPTMAEFVYTPVPGGMTTNTIGIINPAGSPDVLYSLYITSGSGLSSSATFTVTFGAHIVHGPASSAFPFYPLWLQHFNFIYDNSSLEVIHATAAGPWAAAPKNNYASLGQTPGLTSMGGVWPGWPNPSSGITGLSTLSHGFWMHGPTSTMLPTATVPHGKTSVVPFFRVYLHVKSAQESQINMFGITMMTAFTIAPLGIVFTPATWIYGLGAVHEVPEPASLMLLAGGLALVGGRVVARRSRRR